LHECIIERYSAAFDLYLNRKFTEALAGFEELQAALASDFQAPPDRASEVLIQRVKQFIDNPPGEDWDGVDKVKSKAG
jgi:adenylate cyclase